MCPALLPLSQDSTPAVVGSELHAAAMVSVLLPFRWVQSRKCVHSDVVFAPMTVGESCREGGIGVKKLPSLGAGLLNGRGIKA